MKVGILTFHCAHNYGAVLQAYALQEYIKTLGHKVYIIDYRPDYLLKPYSIINKSRLKSKSLIKGVGKFVFELFYLRSRYRKHKKFEKFINEKFSLLPVEKIKELDSIVFGSDQIWNYKITNGSFDKVFLGKFKGKVNEHCKLISYAASSGSIQIPYEAKNEVKNALYKFDAISVREESLRIEILDKLSLAKEVQTVLDPTLLVTSSKLIRNQTAQRRPYVLIYQVCSSTLVYKLAKKISKELNLDIVEINSSVKYEFRSYAYNTIGPDEFLTLFSNASFIITTSFHGTVFSLINEKPFFTIKFGTAVDGRVSNLLKSIGLESRHISGESEFTYSKINYKKINTNLRQLRKESHNFLKRNL